MRFPSLAPFRLDSQMRHSRYVVLVLNRLEHVLMSCDQKPLVTIRNILGIRERGQVPFA